MYDGNIDCQLIVTTLRVVWIEMCDFETTVDDDTVTTLRVVWIEISNEIDQSQADGVTTLRVVWIEIYGI